MSVNVNGTLKGEQITYDVISDGTTLRRQESVIDASLVTVTTALNSNNALNIIRTVEITVAARPDTQATSTSQQVSVMSVIRARVRNR